MEKKDDQGGEYNRCGIGEDDGGGWSEYCTLKGNLAMR